MGKIMGYMGKGTHGAPVLIRKVELSAAASEVTLDNVFDKNFDWHYLVGVDVTIDAANQAIRIIRRSGGSDVTTTLDYMGHYGDNSAAVESALTNQTSAGYFEITADNTGTDATRHTNSFIIAYIANPVHMPTDWGRIMTSGSAGTGSASAGDDFWNERTHQLIGSTGFDGVRMYTTSGNIAGGKFLVYGMA
jgi:hypothetical protein